ncbi:MAG: glycosyltransferase [Cyanobacteria bacterium J06623_7]
MPKIVVIHPQAGIDWNNNAAIFAVDLARRLDNYFEVELLSGAECGSFSRPLDSLIAGGGGLTNSSVFNMMHRWFKQPQLSLEKMVNFLPCITYLLNHPADLLMPQNGYAGLLVANCVRAARGTPILFTEHRNFIPRPKSIERHLALKPNRLIALNPVVAQHVHSLAPQQLLETIPFGIDPTEFTPEGKAISTGLTQPTIISVANLDRHGDRRIELTIKAVARLPQASLLICGEGNDRDYFQALGDRLLGSERFQIRSFAYAQMPLVYRSGSIFTSAARQETRGLKYVEAMACGLPIVATDNPVNRDLIGNAGITCEVTDIPLYAASLQLALENSWCQGQPRQNALRFSWQGITLLYYQAVLKTIATANYQLAAADLNPSLEN